MTNKTFEELSLSPALMTAITEMGFTETTPVQAETIPVIRAGSDLLARSQTGTGKTVAFGIPAVESIDATNRSVQVLILSPTRELAMQCGDEIRKLARHMPHIKTADIYGGSDFNRQFRALRDANIVIGTPGRVMDHMRRETLKLGNLKMVVLDEADEMLNMGFKEDIETILQDVPEERQIVLFSATVPPEILAITRQFQKNPVHIEINRNQVTLDNIKQVYVDVPMYQKQEALKLLFHYYKPRRAIVFANTKTMVDELTEQLSGAGFTTGGLHGDMKQLQRTSVMNGFKRGRVNILVATDVAARGIDVSDIDYVFNFDIPKASDYYVHRIGRTGRAGRTGTAVTLCCGRRQVLEMQQLARKTKSTIESAPLPTVADVERSNRESDINLVRTALEQEPSAPHLEMITELVAEGHAPETIAATLFALAYHHDVTDLINIKMPKKVVRPVEDFNPRSGGGAQQRLNHAFANIQINIGSSNRVAPNHIVGAMTERTGLSAKSIGKIEISLETTVVGVPADQVEEIILSMQGSKICGKPVILTAIEMTRRPSTYRSDKPRYGGNSGGGYRGGNRSSGGAGGGAKPFNRPYKRKTEG